VQCRMARAALGLSTYELADRAGVSRDTINRIEAGDATVKAKTVAAIRSSLEAAGVEFIPENGGGAGVRLKKEPAK
jgi:transcriptional regulator with XRE-family HTH domain